MFTNKEIGWWLIGSTVALALLNASHVDHNDTTYLIVGITKLVFLIWAAVRLIN